MTNEALVFPRELPAEIGTVIVPAVAMAPVRVPVAASKEMPAGTVAPKDVGKSVPVIVYVNGTSGTTLRVNGLVIVGAWRTAAVKVAADEVTYPEAFETTTVKLPLSAA
jgi:hypothetical protein